MMGDSSDVVILSRSSLRAFPWGWKPPSPSFKTCQNVYREILQKPKGIAVYTGFKPISNICERGFVWFFYGLWQCVQIDGSTNPCDWGWIFAYMIVRELTFFYVDSSDPRQSLNWSNILCSNVHAILFGVRHASFAGFGNRCNEKDTLHR